MTNYKRHSELAFRNVREIREVQNAMLSRHLRSAMRNSRFYQRHFNGVDIDSVTIDTLERLPTTRKSDIEANEADFLAVPRNNVAEIVTSSGTSGSPINVFFTANDLKRLEYNELQALSACGVKRSDTVLLTCTLDRCFIAGLAYLLGCRAIGATTIRGGSSPMASHLRFLRELNVNVLIGVPSFLLKLADFAESAGEAPSSLGVKRLVCIGEPLRNHKMEPLPLCSKLEAAWGAKAFSTYASTEMITAFCECQSQCGGHLIPELALVEILDDEGRRLPAGGIGEVTITPFHIEGMPLVRYRTGDMGYLIDEPCECGRNTPRLSPIIGRKHQMIKCRGTTFYPPAISAVLDGLDFVSEYQTTVTREHLSDDVTVTVALTDNSRLAEVEDALLAALRVRLAIKVEPSETLLGKVFPPSARKPVRLVILEAAR